MSQHNVEEKDGCSCEDTKIWAETLYSLLNFLVAQTNLATVLDESPLINPVPQLPQLEDITKGNNPNEYNLEDFPWFVNEMKGMPPSQNIKTAYFCTISPLQQSGVQESEEVYSEPTSLPHNVSVIDTQNMGDCNDIERAIENMHILEQYVFRSTSQNYDATVSSYIEFESGSSSTLSKKATDPVIDAVSVEKTSSTPDEDNISRPFKSVLSSNETTTDNCKVTGNTIVENISTTSCFSQEYTDSAQSLNSQNLQSACESLNNVNSDEYDDESTYFEVSQNNKRTISGSTIYEEDGQLIVNTLMSDILDDVRNCKVIDSDSDEISSIPEVTEIEESPKFLSKVVSPCKAQEKIQKSEEMQTVDKRRYQGTLKAVIAKTIELRKPLQSSCYERHPLTETILKITSNNDNQCLQNKEEKFAKVRTVPKNIRELETELKALHDNTKPSISTKPVCLSRRMENRNKPMDKKSYAVTKKSESPKPSTSSTKPKVALSARYAHIESKVKTMLQSNKNAIEGEDKLSDYFTKAKVFQDTKRCRKNYINTKVSSKPKTLERPAISTSKSSPTSVESGNRKKLAAIPTPNSLKLATLNNPVNKIPEVNSGKLPRIGTVCKNKPTTQKVNLQVQDRSMDKVVPSQTGKKIKVLKNAKIR